ncbi:hypothetical protein SEVIR_7G171800v4 [Setaria viridis]|uniref:HTH myb-type domain-containing protein n=1 Tax=Setaria viridis TaxID=4556 RepID=A0A4U6TW58_SETVI|nr:protein PHOSPHATE STARVATION RESPONSE 2-like [Setaria viridis]XP_034601724.1 protein PHOSPHATE STARVATION RESPONSE 2-like [Setaria viridis]TKW05383.1 hypothetical protein SEVIR_7G171800v2 [Setaria viridis]TKW05384.1 hypothetical protein SEVIR_7G171800v2 [Setaria viridis]
MALQSLPASTGAPCSTSVASSSSTFSTVIVHGRFPNVTPSIVHSLNTEIWSSDPISYSGVSEQLLGGNYPVLPAEATHSADQLGDLLNNNDIGVEKLPDCGPVREPNESDDRDEWLRCLVTGGLDDIITADMTLNYPQMAESAPVSSYLNSETRQDEHIVHQLVSVPTIPGQLYPTVSPPATINVHSPLRTKVRRRWTTEMHDRFVDAVNQLGGCENAKPKAILDIMNVEGLTREQVKSHLQKYKLAQVRHRPSEVAGTSVDTATSNEGIPSDVQIRIQEFALQVQIEFQKKLHEMVERTRRDLLEIHRSVLEKHVMSLHELEERQNLNTDRSILHLLPSPAAGAAAPPSALSAGGSIGVCGEGSRTAALVEDVQASEAGSLGNKAGA